MAAGDVTIKGDSKRTIRGQRIVWGEVQLDGANPTPIALARFLASIDELTATFRRTTAPALDPVAITWDRSGTTANIYAWKHTLATDATLIASTNNTAIVSFIAIGPKA